MTYSIALALLLFGVSFNLVVLLSPFRQLRFSILKSSLLASGATLALLSGFTIWMLYSDYTLRCLYGPTCESVLDMYVVPALVQSVGVALGLILTVLGFRLGGAHIHSAEKLAKRFRSPKV